MSYTRARFCLAPSSLASARRFLVLNLVIPAASSITARRSCGLELRICPMRPDTASFGVTGGHESVTNSYITDAAFSTFPIDPNEISIYPENRYAGAGRLFLSGGVRAEFFRTASIPTDGYTRPFFPQSNIARVNPKLSAAYAAGGVRLHASFGMGLRPPSGFDLAFTDRKSVG